MPGGTIGYYEDAKLFLAKCSEGDCEVRRTALPGAQAAVGRPLGFMMAWLADRRDGRGDSHDASAHKQRKTYHRPSARVPGRELLMTPPGGPELLACERRLVDGEKHEEPWRNP